MDTLTDITLRLVFGLGIWLCGIWYLARLLYARTAPLRHQVVNHKPLQQAITLAETDRFIRDQEHELYPDEKLDHLNCAVCGPGPLLQGMVPSKFEHPFFVEYEEEHSNGYGTWKKTRVLRPRRAADAEMVSSAVIENGKYTGMHTLMLDLDFPVTLVESTTPGHHHLYADHQMTWLEYRGMLKAMANAGLIEHGYYRAAVRQRATMLRPPWVKKPPELPAGKSSPVPKQLLNHAKWWKRWTE